MMSRPSACLIALLFSELIAVLLVSQAAADSMKVAHTWFTPSLVVNEDPHCPSILSAARQKFLTSRNWEERSGVLGDEVAGFNRVPEPSDKNPGTDPAIKANPDDARKFIFAAPGQESAFLAFQVNLGGCGDGCEREKVVVSDAVTAEDESPSTPPAASWTIYRADDGEHFLLGIIEGQLEAYRVTAPKNWKLSCRVTLVPDLEKSNDIAVKEATKALASFKAASKGLSRAGGSCGSLAADYRVEANVAETLKQALYRPWVFYDGNAVPDDKERNYEKIFGNFEKWSLGGLSEWNAFLAYRAELSGALSSLAAFYEAKFGWTEQKSTKLAADALRDAIGGSFVFSEDYDPFPHAGEAELRKAILDHRPMTEIEAIAFDPAQIDEAGADSILNTAVAYPEALRYLLMKKFNPNQANPFGKTPLMYAVQYNQFDSAKMLLAAGADPNARTIAPADTCEYAISTTNMTPLHYAVRYASGDIIRLLVEQGAVAFIKAQRFGAAGETPLDWLRRYTSGQSAEKQNPALRPAEVAGLMHVLVAQSDADLVKIAASEVGRAEKAYAEGDAEKAYRLTNVALAADPNNQKALSDLPLLALKTGRMGEAAEGANKATKSLKTVAAQAASWFNLGLICEQLPHGIAYNGSFYCLGDHVDPFMQAWRLQPNPTRARKLIDAVQKDEFGACAVENRRYKFISNPGLNGGERIYVLHRADESIEPSSIQLIIDGIGAKETRQIPRATGRFVLDEQAISLLEADRFAKNWLVDGKSCTRN